LDTAPFGDITVEEFGALAKLRLLVENQGIKRLNRKFA